MSPVPKKGGSSSASLPVTRYIVRAPREYYPLSPPLPPQEPGMYVSIASLSGVPHKDLIKAQVPFHVGPNVTI